MCIPYPKCMLKFNKNVFRKNMDPLLEIDIVDTVGREKFSAILQYFVK